MELYKYYPIASDRMGILWTLATIQGAVLVEFGPAGTTHYAVESIGALNGEDLAKIYSTHIDDEDLAFGDLNRLEKSIMEIDINIKPKYIFVMASSLSSIIGADVKSLCYEIEDKVNAKLIPIETGGLKEDYNSGVEEVLMILGKNVVGEGKEKNGRYNIIGCNIDSFNFSADRVEIERIMRELFNKEINTVFTANTTIEEIENASRAEFNIVLRKEGLSLAKYMEKKFNIPYVYSKPIGLKETLSFIEKVENTMGYEANKEKLKMESEEVSKYIKRISFRIRAFESRDVAIFGDFNTVVSMKKFMKEVGLRVDRAEVLHRVKNIEHLDECEGLLFREDEYEREKYLREKELLLLLGDGTTLNMESSSKSKVQISNPNFDMVNIYDYTPFVGFRGAIYILEKLFRIKNY